MIQKLFHHCILQVFSIIQVDLLLREENVPKSMFPYLKLKFKTTSLPFIRFTYLEGTVHKIRNASFCLKKKFSFFLFFKIKSFLSALRSFTPLMQKWNKINIVLKKKRKRIKFFLKTNYFNRIRFISLAWTKKVYFKTFWKVLVYFHVY